jgi:intein/homing endonuclease
MLYEIDQHPYLSVFYNGTIEVVESGGFLLSGESVFLITLGFGLLVLLGFWVNGQIHHFSKVHTFAFDSTYFIEKKFKYCLSVLNVKAAVKKLVFDLFIFFFFLK